MSSDLSLTPEQLAFMKLYHEEIERAMIEVKKGNHEPLEAVIRFFNYMGLFGDMEWDDALDRYEDSPEYDPALRIALHEQLNADIKAGRVQLPTSSRKPKIRTEADENDDVRLVILKQIQRKK